MVILMNSSFFAFKMSLLRNYCGKYYDYVVKWCSGIACNWCASLDIASICPLSTHGTQLAFKRCTANNGHFLTFNKA